MGKLKLYDVYTPLPRQEAQNLALILNEGEEDDWSYCAKQVGDGPYYRVEVFDAEGRSLGFL